MSDEKKITISEQLGILPERRVAIMNAIEKALSGNDNGIIPLDLKCLSFICESDIERVYAGYFYASILLKLKEQGIATIYGNEKGEDLEKIEKASECYAISHFTSRSPDGTVWPSDEDYYDGLKKGFSDGYKRAMEKSIIKNTETK